MPNLSFKDASGYTWNINEMWLWDGKSQPWYTWGWRFQTPFTGPGRIASIIHDWGVKKAAAIAKKGEVDVAVSLRLRVDRAFRDCLLLLGKDPTDTWLMYRGVRLNARLTERKWRG